MPNGAVPPPFFSTNVNNIRGRPLLTTPVSSSILSIEVSVSLTPSLFLTRYLVYFIHYYWRGLMVHRLLQGIVPGRSHILDARNCQDALSSITFEINGKSYVAGVVADGCGGGKHSQVGAQLAVQFIPREIRRLVKNSLPL